MKYTIGTLFLCFALYLQAQIQDSSKSKLRDGEYFSTTVIDGKVVPIIIIDGDTLPTIEAPDVTVMRKKDFESRE